MIEVNCAVIDQEIVELRPQLEQQKQPGVAEVTKRFWCVMEHHSNALLVSQQR